MYRKDKKKEFFTQKAKKEGYPARSVYKLEEIDKKYHLIRIGDSVLDLGCAPGSWLLYCSQAVGHKGKVVGIDIVDLNIQLPKNCVFLKTDVMDFKISQLKELGNKHNVVVSDMAPSTSGVKFVDAGRSLELSQRAFEIACEVLSFSGNFVCKIFEGYEADKFINEVKKSFNFVKRLKPKAVIKQSKEFYIIASGFKANLSNGI